MGRGAARVLAAPVGSDRAGYGTKIRPLGVTTPLTVTVPTAPVFRLIVPKELGGKAGGDGQAVGALLALHGATAV